MHMYNNEGLLNFNFLMLGSTDPGIVPPRLDRVARRIKSATPRPTSKEPTAESGGVARNPYASDVDTDGKGVDGSSDASDAAAGGSAGAVDADKSLGKVVVLDVTSESEDDEDPAVDALLLTSSFVSGMVTRTHEIDGVIHKWCFTCKIWRKPGTVHCGVCGFCMEEYDHHCPVVGVCIARRNHRWFIGMWLAAGVAGVIGFVGCVLRIIDIKEKYAGAMEKEWTTYFAVIGMLYMTVLAMSTGCTGVNMGNVAALRLTADMRQTLGREGTKQFIKDAADKRCQNCAGFWCVSFSGFRRKTHPFGVGRGYCCCH